MNILVIGSGGREHALAWKLKQSADAEKIYCAPGNAGTASIAENTSIQAEDTNALADFAERNSIGLTVVGPEQPLVSGLVDALEKRSLRAFGPSGKAAMLEGSKVFAKQIMKKYRIPTAEFSVFHDADEALDYTKELGGKVVVKADGLAAGKGVFVCGSLAEAKDAITKTMVEKKFGSAGEKIVVEELLQGEEASILAFTDGRTVVPMASAQDHKRVFDNDKGPNCYSADTEILTENGWKTFDVINKEEKVAVFEPKTRSIYFEEPTEIHWMRYKGEMVHFKHRLLDLLVTPNHRMLTEKRKSKKMHVIEAKKLAGENNILLSCNWKGQDLAFFFIPAHDYKFNRLLKSHKICFNDWIRFLAIYLSEGYVSIKDKRVYICQSKKSPHFSEIKKILGRLPFNFSYSARDSKFRINSVQLVNILRDFGRSKQKLVPDYVKLSRKKTIWEFLKCYNIGDGDLHRGAMRFSTASKRMADDLQELILRCGSTGIITVDRRKEMTNPINKKKYPASLIYSVEITKRKTIGIRKKDIATVAYNGYVGCVTVSSGFVVVRRNGRIAISGNTGGMGAYSPAPVVTQDMEERIVDEVLKPTVRAMRFEGAPYKGVLYAGLMINKDEINVLEFNARFGDPETQAILPRMESDIVSVFESCIGGRLADEEIMWSKKAATCIVVASGGYPEAYEKGKVITGLDAVSGLKDVEVFHAGTKIENGKVVTSGGRVLGVTGLGSTVKDSIKRAYAAVEKIKFDKMHYRRDIGFRALKRWRDGRK